MNRLFLSLRAVSYLFLPEFMRSNVRVVDTQIVNLIYKEKQKKKQKGFVPTTRITIFSSRHSMSMHSPLQTILKIQ